MKLDLADIATNEKKQLQGFKILGVFPFYLKYIRTDTHIQLCKIRVKLNKIAPGEDRETDFYNPELQSVILPLINEYCVIALVNNRVFGWLYRTLLKRKIKTCSHSHILSLYLTIHKLNEPAFFLAYWTLINKKESTLLKEDKQ